MNCRRTNRLAHIHPCTLSLSHPPWRSCILYERRNTRRYMHAPSTTTNAFDYHREQLLYRAPQLAQIPYLLFRRGTRCWYWFLSCAWISYRSKDSINYLKIPGTPLGLTYLYVFPQKWAKHYPLHRRGQSGHGRHAIKEEIQWMLSVVKSPRGYGGFVVFVRRWVECCPLSPTEITCRLHRNGNSIHKSHWFSR